MTQHRSAVGAADADHARQRCGSVDASEEAHETPPCRWFLASRPGAQRDSSPDRIVGFINQTALRRRRRPRRIANGSHAATPIPAAPAACISGPSDAAKAHHTMPTSASNTNVVHAAAGRVFPSRSHARPSGTPPTARHTHPSALDAGTPPPIPAVRTAAEPGSQPTTSSTAAALAATLRPCPSSSDRLESRSGGWRIGANEVSTPIQ